MKSKIFEVKMKLKEQTDVEETQTIFSMLNELEKFVEDNFTSVFNLWSHAYLFPKYPVSSITPLLWIG